MNLRNFYLKNVKKEDYHHRFFSAVNTFEEEVEVFGGVVRVSDIDFNIIDDDDAINMFKDLCRPKNDDFDDRMKCLFYGVAYYLHKNGYTIKEFPRILARPPKEPRDFTYHEIRNRIVEDGGEINGTVTYSKRRQLISKLHFTRDQNAIEVNDTIDQMFVRISTRNASFNNMSVDEKLLGIANFIEFTLKTENGFKKIDYTSICFDYINDDYIKRFRKQLQCCRHADKNAITERESFTDPQKDFLIDLGILISKSIYIAIKEVEA